MEEDELSDPDSSEGEVPEGEDLFGAAFHDGDSAAKDSPESGAELHDEFTGRCETTASLCAALAYGVLDNWQVKRVADGKIVGRIRMTFQGTALMAECHHKNKCKLLVSFTGTHYEAECYCVKYFILGAECTCEKHRDDIQPRMRAHIRESK